MVNFATEALTALRAPNYGPMDLLPWRRKRGFRWKAWTETVPDKTSLNNLYRAFEWFSTHDDGANRRVLVFFASVVGLLFVLVIALKLLTRTSTPWHASPLAVALLLLHLAGDLEFDTVASGTLVEVLQQWIGGVDSLLRLSSIQQYRGPAAYSLIVLAVWEAAIFGLSPLVLSKPHPRSRSLGEWFLFTTMIFMVYSFIDTKIELPLLQLSGQYGSTKETYQSMEIFVRTVFVFNVFLLAPMALLAVLLDYILFDGCLLTFLLNNIDNDEHAISPPRQSQEEVASPTVVLLETKHLKEPEPPVFALVEQFLWKQMCVIKQQAQEVDSCTIEVETDQIYKAYDKLGHIVGSLKNLRPPLQAVVAISRDRPQKARQFEQQLAAVQETIIQVEAQMKQLTLDQSDIRFIRQIGGVDPVPLIKGLAKREDKALHIRLERQHLQEQFVELEEELEETAKSLDNNPETSTVEHFYDEVGESLSTMNTVINRLVKDKYGNRETPIRFHPIPRYKLPPAPVPESQGLRLDTGNLRPASRVVSTEGLTSSNPVVILDEDSPSPGKRSSMSILPRPSPRANPSSISATNENAGPSGAAASRTAAVKKSADHMVVGLWSHSKSLTFRSDNFLRGASGSDLLTADNLLEVVDLGKYLTSKVRGNRAETAAASKILNNLERIARSAKDNGTSLNVGTNNINYFRSCMWLGQARRTRFGPIGQDRVCTEIPIEGIIKLSGYGPDGIKSLNLLPVPQETWSTYLKRLSLSSDIKKVKELHEWLERYTAGDPRIIDREVPRAEGWDTGVPLDTNRCLFRHLENMLLLPPYSGEVEKALRIHKIEKAPDDPNSIGTALAERVLSSPKEEDIDPFQSL